MQRPGTLKPGFLVTLASIVLGGASHATELADQCTPCHGHQGYSLDEDVPVIAGFSYDGFVDALDAFRDGERHAVAYQAPGSPLTLMNEIAQRLSDDEVEELAAYFSALPFVPRTQFADRELAAKGAEVHEKHCERCHSNGGSDPEDDAAILAGQWMPYLKRQFDDITSGKRKVPRAMLRRFSQLDEGEKEALLHFYANQQ